MKNRKKSSLKSFSACKLFYRSLKNTFRVCARPFAFLFGGHGCVPSFGFKKAFSLMEIMFALVALSVMLAALAPMLAKKISRSVGSVNPANAIITGTKCKDIISTKSANCYACNTITKECLGCNLTCDSSKTLNIATCECK